MQQSIGQLSAALMAVIVLEQYHIALFGLLSMDHADVRKRLETASD